MFGLFKKKNPYEQPARSIYGAAMDRVRTPLFYREMAVPDTIDGRFDLLLLHLFMVIRAHRDEKGQADLAQALFDITFAHMDQSLREAGVGDMGVPKHMRRMMLAFNGRMHAYDTALEGGDLDGALARNLYGTLENPPQPVLSGMAEYVRDNIEFIGRQDFTRITAGEIAFAPLEQARQYGT